MSIKNVSIDSIKTFIDESKFNRFHSILAIWCLFIVTLEGYNLAVFGTVIPLLFKEFNISSAQIGVIGSCGIAGMMIGAIVLSPFSEKIGHKKLLIFSVVFYTVFISISAFTSSYQVFATCRFLGGVGFGAALPLVISILTEYAPKTSKNKLITLSLTGYQIGGILAPLAGIAFIALLGWRSIILFAILPLIVLPFLIKGIADSPHFLMKKGKYDELEAILARIDTNYKNKLTDNNIKIIDKKDSVIEENAAKVPTINLFRNNLALATIIFCIMNFCGIFIVNLLITWLPNIMILRGMSLTSGLSVTIALNLGTMIGTYAWSAYADRNGLSKKLLVTIYLLGAASLALIGTVTNISILYVLITATGFFLLSGNTMLSAYVSHYYPDDVRSTGVGFGLGVGQIGGVLGPSLGGVLIGLNVPMNYCFLIFGLAGLICAVAILLVKSRAKGESGQNLDELKFGKV